MGWRGDGGESRGVLVLPVLGGVRHSGKQLHGFGVVMDLCVEVQILLHKVTGGHKALAILIHNTGILTHTHTNEQYSAASLIKYRKELKEKR